MSKSKRAIVKRKGHERPEEIKILEVSPSGKLIKFVLDRVDAIPRWEEKANIEIVEELK